MAQVNCAMLAAAESAAPAAALPMPMAAPDLAAWASSMPADPRERVTAETMAALPSWAPATEAPAAAAPPQSRADQAAAASAAAAAAAQSQGAALSSMVEALAAQGPIDPDALASRIGNIAGTLPPPLAGASATLAEHAAHPPQHTATEEPPPDATADPPALPTAPRSASPAPALATRVWASPVAARPPPDTGRWGSSNWSAADPSAPAQANASDWVLASPSSTFADWGTLAARQPQTIQQPSGTMRSIYRPLDAPPCAPGLLAGIANVAGLYRQLSGRTLADPVSLKDLGGTIDSFNACLAAQPEPPPVPASLAQWGAAGRGVAAIRNQMGVDLLQPDAGPALQAAIRERQAALATPVPAWMAQRAQAAMQWLELDQMATALGLPVRGPGALARLGAAVRLVTSTPLPPCTSPSKAAACLARTDNIAAIRDGFGIDPLAPDGPARLQQADATLSRTLAAYPIPQAPTPEAARGLTRSAMQRFGQIDRSQADDLGLRQVNAGDAPVLTSAPLVLSVLDAISRLRRATLFQPASRMGL